VREAGGFTLIEVIIVVFIIGLMSALAVVALTPSSASTADREARRLMALLELASAEARTSGNSFAWSAEGSRYTFWTRSEDGEWKGFPESSTYRHRELDMGLEFIEVIVGARPVAPGERVYLAPHGLRAPMEVTIRDATTRLVLRGDAFGRMEIEQSNAHDALPRTRSNPH